MRKLSFLLLFLAVTMFAQAQIATDIYWVQFTDKDNSPYSIDNPEAYLSPRALQRRANLGITIDEEKNSIRGEETIISTEDSKVKVLVVPTNEELMIARDTEALAK